MTEPDRRLYFLLQQAAHRLRVAADRRCLEVAGITAAQLGALFVLAEQPGATQRELAAVLGQRESAITAMVGRLHGAGLVSREAHPTEYRAVALHLTDVGTETLDRVRPVMAEFNAAMGDALGERGFRHTTESLRKLIRMADAGL